MFCPRSLQTKYTAHVWFTYTTENHFSVKFVPWGAKLSGLVGGLGGGGGGGRMAGSNGCKHQALHQ